MPMKKQSAQHESLIEENYSKTCIHDAKIIKNQFKVIKKILENYENLETPLATYSGETCT